MTFKLVDIQSGANVALLGALSATFAVACASARVPSPIPRSTPTPPQSARPEQAQRPIPEQSQQVLVAVPTRLVEPNRVTLVIPAVTPSSASCELIEKVSGQSATFTIPREGEPVQVDFSSDPFSGTLKDGVLDISYYGLFEWADGCKWKTIQRIHGPLASGTLSYTYFELPLPDQLDCAPSCSGKAEVRVTEYTQGTPTL